MKCDLRRPTCYRCEKSKIPCYGYKKDPVFINHTIARPSVNAASVIAAARHAQTRAQLLPVHEEAMRSLICQVTSSSPYIPIEFRKKAVRLVKKTYLPRSLPDEQWYLVGAIYGWVWSLSTLSEKSKALDLAIIAFLIVQTHITKTSFVSMEDGLRFYSEALTHHRRDLQDEEKRSRNESFATIIVLMTCEVVISPHKLVPSLTTAI